MDLRGYLRAIRKYWWIVLTFTVLGTAAGALIAYSSTPKYTSTVTFFVSTPSDSQLSALASDQFAQRRVESYAGLLTSQRLAQMVVTKGALDKKGSLSISAHAVMSEISASTDLNTVLLTATVTDESPERALAIATGISTELS